VGCSYLHGARRHGVLTMQYSHAVQPSVLPDLQFAAAYLYCEHGHADAHCSRFSQSTAENYADSLLRYPETHAQLCCEAACSRHLRASAPLLALEHRHHGCWKQASSSHDTANINGLLMLSYASGGTLACQGPVCLSELRQSRIPPSFSACTRRGRSCTLSSSQRGSTHSPGPRNAVLTQA